MSFADCLDAYNTGAGTGPYWADISFNNTNVNGLIAADNVSAKQSVFATTVNAVNVIATEGVYARYIVVDGVTGPNSCSIVVKSGSGTGDYNLVITDGTTGASIDAANLDYTVTIPIGYKLTIDAVATFSMADSFNSAFIYLYDGGINGTGGTLLDNKNYIFSSNSNNVDSNLHAVITGDGLSHHIQYMGTSIGGSGEYILNSTQTASLAVIPKVSYRLELSS